MFRDLEDELYSRLFTQCWSVKINKTKFDLRMLSAVLPKLEVGENVFLFFSFLDQLFG